MVLARANEVESLNRNPNMKRRFDNKRLRHPVLDFYTPHELGGLGDPIDARYSQVNTYPDTIDIPVIRPRTTVTNKNEFNVNIVNSNDIKEADMSLFRKTLKEQAEAE